MFVLVSGTTYKQVKVCGSSGLTPTLVVVTLLEVKKTISHRILLRGNEIPYYKDKCLLV